MFFYTFGHTLAIDKIPKKSSLLFMKLATMMNRKSYYLYSRSLKLDKCVTISYMISFYY